VKRSGAYACIGAIGLALMTIGVVQAADLGYSFKSLAALDTTVAGVPIHGDFELGAVNASGAVVFVTELDNGEGGLMIEANGKQTLLSMNGADAPGGGKFGGYISNKIGLNDAGDILLSVGVDPGDGEVQSVLDFDKTANKWTTVAKKGMPAPDAGTIQGTNSFGGLNSKNDVVFAAMVDDSSAGPAGSGIFLWSGGKYTTVVRPGTKTARGTFGDSWRPQISDSGVVTFEGKIGDDSDYGAYMWKDGQLTELASVVTAVPGGSGKFSALKGVVANSNGDIAMLGNTDAGWGVYLYTATDKKLNKIAAPGDDAPGGGKFGDAFNGYRNSVRMGEDGTVVFESMLDSGSGIFLWKGGKIGVVERTDQTLAGVGKAADNHGDGLGLSSNGLLGFTVNTTDGKTQLVLGTPPAAGPAP
jgi:hypothetical protein